VAWNWADEFAFDFFAVFRFGDHWASFWWAHARAAWAAHRADEWRRASDANHCHLWLLLLFGVVGLADRAEANKCTACRSFRFGASLGGFFTGAAVARLWANDFHSHRLFLFFGVMRANWAMADKFATFGPFRHGASFRDFLAGAAWKGRWAVGRHGDFHHWFRLLLLLGMVRWADWTMADTFAAFWSFRFRASFRDFLAGAAWKSRWAGSVRFHRGFSEFHFDVFDADVWADERAFEQFAVVGSFNWRATFWRAFARTAWARRRANLLLEG